ncbi:MAG: glycogen debranching enzyme, partial [Chlamydiia bacterium]|nr:glycogen debranching enzyme [Chlamydiia bacterium]
MIDEFIISPGSPTPLGCSKNSQGFNFALFSSHASQVTLGLRKKDKIYEIPLFQTGPIWHIAISGEVTDLTYAFRVDGLSAPQKGILFTPSLWLQDPWSPFPVSQSLPWKSPRNDPWSHVLEEPPFDWEGVQKPNIPFSDLIIYEMHLRGFTCHPSSKSSHPGTFLGLIEKIPYFKSLGINAIELMPIFLFDEEKCKNIDPSTQTLLCNY